MTSIPASQIVNVIPNVVSAGGNGVALSGLILTESTRVPIGQVLSFPNDGQSVSDYFGPSAPETALAQIYFNGYDGSTQKPANVLFAQYPGTAVTGYLRGGPVGKALTLTQLQALATGTLTLSVAGTPITSSSINLSAATSFSDAANIIEAAFTTPPFSVSYDSVSEAFVFTTNSAGATQTITYCSTNALATSLELTAATGAVLSQGADAASPGTFMDSIAQSTQAWATFMTVFDPDGGSGNTVKQEFAAWTNSQNNRFMYAVWDTDITPTQSGSAVSSLGYILKAANSSGSCPIYDPNNGAEIAAFVCGSVASLDFAALNGRATEAFRRQSGLTAGVTTATAAQNLVANGYNYYGGFATEQSTFIFFYPGLVSGEYDWIDSYVNQIWLNTSLQEALLSLLLTTNSIPYNTQGYEQIKAACMDPILAAVNFGAIRQGVALSAQQAAQVNAAAGTKIDTTLATQGWYLQVLPASSAVRIARTSPTINLWYMDGQSVQQITLNSYLVQ